MFVNAESYERFMGRWSRRIAVRFLEFSAMPDEGLILDLGAGTGSLSFEIVQRKARAFVAGVDPSKEYIAYAKRMNRNLERAAFAIGDAQLLPFAGATFAATVSLLVFNFIPDPLKAIQEAFRVTSPGGTIAAAVWDYGGSMRMLRTFWDSASTIDEHARRLDEAHMPLCRSGELAELWKVAGLENVRAQPLEIEMKFETFEDYWNPFLLGQGPAGAFVSRLDAAALLRLKGEVKRRLSLAADDVSFALPARAWGVRGTVPLARGANI